MVVNETRNCLVTDILLNIEKSAEYIPKTVKLKCFYSGGVVKCTYFHKKRSIPLMKNPHKKTHWIYNRTGSAKTPGYFF